MFLTRLSITFRLLVSKTLDISDQLLITLWSLTLTFLFANLFSKPDFIAYSLYYASQLISLMLVNSTFGQMLILEGSIFTFRSIMLKILFFTFILFLVLMSLFLTEILTIIDFNIVDGLLFSLSIASFVSYELLRRYLYSLNFFRLSLISVISFCSLMVLALSTIYILYGNFQFTAFLYANLICHLTVILFLQWKVRKSQIQKKSEIILNVLTFKDIFDFCKWLILGIIFYIIANNLFIFYLNSFGAHEDVITLRLLETVFGIALVFCASFENYFIAILRNKSLRQIFNSLYTVWAVLITSILVITPFLENILSTFFSHDYYFDTAFLFLLIITYCLFIFSRILVIYVRINQLNKALYYGNLFSAIIVLIVFILKTDIGLSGIFYLKALFTIINLIVYYHYYLQHEKKDYYLSRLRSR